MAIASVHLEKGNIGEFFHNDRTKETKNSIFDKSENEYDKTAKEALELYQKLLKERAEKYTQRTGQKLQKKAQTLLSVIVNIKPDTTLQDLQKLANKFEKEFGATPLQIAIHRDEGFTDENGKKHINQHAHIMLIGLDKDGYSVKRKIKTRHLREMQDWAAEILGMERGQSVKKTGRKRLDTYEYKEAMKLKNKEVIELKKELIKKDNEIENLKETKKFLENQIKQLREQMKNFNANLQEKEFTQQDYKALSEIKKLLKANSINEVKEKLENFEAEIKQRIRKRQLNLIDKYSETSGIINKKKILDKELAIKITKATTKTENINFINILDENERLKRENEKLKNENQQLKAENASLKAKLSHIKDEILNSIGEHIKAIENAYRAKEKEIRRYAERYLLNKEGKLTKLVKQDQKIDKEITKEKEKIKNIIRDF